MGDDPRLKDIVQLGDRGTVVLLGFPYDEGVGINGGRLGARQGPARFRHWMGRFGTVNNPEYGIDLSRLILSDAGDLPEDLPLEEAHQALTEKVEAVLKQGGIPFVVGGGNDQSWPNARALLNQSSGRKAGVINIDAHLDVRPLKDGRAHSGSPFRLLLEDDRFSGTHFVEFGTQGSHASPEHVEYVKRKEGNIRWLSEIYQNDNAVQIFSATLGSLAFNSDSVFVSFDMDSIRMADAPGLSCPSIKGLRGREALEIARIAGKNSKVKLFDLSEYNPLIEDERTGRLAAAMFYYFCLGVASRKEGA